MNTETLRQIFKSPFDYTTYSREIVHRLFGCHDVASRPEWLDTNAEGDQSFFIGQMDDADHRLLGFFYTRVAEGGDVRRKRVGLRKLISPYLKYDVDGAIAVFDDGRHWRLSYICDLKEGSTSAKRFSYILGDENGQYKTPLERLEKVARLNGRLTLSDLRESFSVDALSDEFFDEYHLHYDRIVANLTQSYRRDVTWRVSTDGTSDTRLHDYVKKMMGRIVFLHFLQKKGWLNGNPTFLRDLFLSSPHQADFLEQVLEPLFFGIFNTEPEQREKLFADEQWDKGLLKQWEHLPYLNGGLFERDEVDKMNIKLPASLFNDLFTFLASYNFTVDENDPDDAEIGVDPEMLGKIFESLLEDNKAKGAFYTPKEIVRYMCKESLIAYLTQQLADGRDVPWRVSTDSAIRTFVETHEFPDELEPYHEILDRALREVKICDPAIGSGAFPMGLLNELWRCREALSISNEKLVISNDGRAALKREIIENNIYGVDIERGAIDIARLRFWLSIVVDSEEPQALPNFDYKFMQGNSLIESFEGVDLSRMMSSEGQHSSLGKGRQKAGSNQLGIEFVSTDTKRNLQLMLREYFSLTDHVKKAEARREINDSVKNYIRHQDLRPEAVARLASLDPSANQEFFLWHTWFKDIFDRGGFDIVVGNPPYIKEYENKQAFTLLKGGKYYKAKMDIWFYFACFGIDIITDSGVLCIIAQPQWRNSSAASILRNKICEEARIIQLIDFGTYMVFEASTQAMILLLQKDYYPKYTFHFKQNESLIQKNSDLLSFLSTPFSEIEFDSKKFHNAPFTFRANDSVSVILSKISNLKNFELDKNKEIIQGIIGGPDDAFKLKNNELSLLSIEEKKYAKPFHTSTSRYHTPNNDEYILYISDKNIDRVSPENVPAIYSKLLPYQETLLSRREVLNGRKSWFSLWWERDEKFFLPGPKIVFAARTLGRNFTYTEDSFYASRNCFFIKTERANMKYLVGLLNSKLMHFYMDHNLKHNGDLLQLDKVQFLTVPLYCPSTKQQTPIIAVVDKILDAKKSYPSADTSVLEREIDRLVYELYGLTEGEIKVAEGKEV